MGLEQVNSLNLKLTLFFKVEEKKNEKRLKKKSEPQLPIGIKWAVF